VNNGTGACSTGHCGVGACNVGFADCNAVAADGCEINVRIDKNNCGACGRICAAVANGTGACTAGLCGVGVCNAGFANCDGASANGCETAIGSDVNNCGGCAIACPVRANAGRTCTAGVCGMGACNAGFSNCDGVAANGCEVNLTTDPNNCGACANVCSGATPRCVASVCAP
jgi:hypothetical protein